MKSSLLIFLLLLTFFSKAQYYYKDIVGTKETADLIKNYRNNKVARVVLTSYDAENTKNDDFYVEQTYSNQVLKTITRSGISDESTLISYTDDNGNVIRTVDSSETMTSTSAYNYSPNGQLLSIISNSTDSSHKTSQTEEHLWEYNNERISRMLRIKDKKDTAYITFKFDDKGNTIEEQSTRKGISSEPVYYYYDNNNRLTDIVRYNNKARRLLPEYLFEYSPKNSIGFTVSRLIIASLNLQKI